MKNARDAVSSHTRRTVIRATLGSLAAGLFAGTGAASTVSATEQANDFQTKFNNKATSIKKWANRRLTGRDAAIEVQFEDSDGNTASRYIVTEADSSGDLTRVEAMDEQSFQDVDLIVDWAGILAPYAGKNFPTVIGDFASNYFPPNSDPSQSYVDDLDAEYGNYADGQAYTELLNFLSSLS